MASTSHCGWTCGIRLKFCVKKLKAGKVTTWQLATMAAADRSLDGGNGSIMEIWSRFSCLNSASCGIHWKHSNLNMPEWVCKILEDHWWKNLVMICVRRRDGFNPKASHLPGFQRWGFGTRIFHCHRPSDHLLGQWSNDKLNETHLAHYHVRHHMCTWLLQLIENEIVKMGNLQTTGNIPRGFRNSPGRSSLLIFRWNGSVTPCK